jgi:predicted O-linked N-acetylglucosamine transferase (SPINDLY family)
MATISEALAIAIQHHQAGWLGAAEQIYRQILQVEPAQPDALHLLGTLACQRGQHAAAVDCIGRAIAIRADVAEYYSNLGTAYRGLEKLDQAIACYRRALEIAPDYANAHYNLGKALKDRGQLDAAIACYRRAVQLDPRHVESYINLGNMLREQGQLAEAIACSRRALELRPESAEACNNLAAALGEQGAFAEAVDCCQRGLGFKPDMAELYSNLGNLRRGQGKLDDAEACHRQALALRPGLAEAHNNLGNVLHDQGRLDDALVCYRQALQLSPGFMRAFNNVLLCEQYRPGVTPARLAALHAEWYDRFAAPWYDPGRRHANRRDPDRPLRLGFVSADFGFHPVGSFLVHPLEALARRGVQSVCYSLKPREGSIRARLFAAATTWREVRPLSDDALADQIRDDAIDILFDLSGHTFPNRLLVFARKPAPVQITWMGYVGTTGLPAMDYLLADRYQVPPSSEPYYRERVLRMPDGYVCVDPPADAPAVTPLPARAAGYVTLGCFNNPAKVSPPVIDVWARILERLPGARLVLKYQGFDNPSEVRRLTQMFSIRCIDPSRVDLRGWSDHAQLLEQYGGIDLALDPFPYSGGLTTCEALWMGVPVITCPGETFAGRHALSHLSNVGLTETIARNFDHYVDLAVAWASDLPRLAATRADLRGRMAASPLCDAERFADNLMALLRDAWRQWIGA